MLQFDILQVHFQEGKVSPATAELYKALKDHKNPFMQDLVLQTLLPRRSEEGGRPWWLMHPPQSENGTDEEEDEQ